MEPLAALSLASNVIQVVDFSIRVVSKSSELYRSGNGQLVQHTDISTTSSDLNRLTSRLSASIADPSVHTVLNEDEQALYVLCKGCIDVSTELEEGLNKLQVFGTPSKWKSLRKALKTIWTKEHILELRLRLSDYRDQLDSRILLNIKSRLDLVALRQSEAFTKLDENIKDLVKTWLNSAAKLELKIDQRASVTDLKTQSIVHGARDSVVESIADAKALQQQAIQSVEARLTDLRTTDQQILTNTGESRDAILSSIARSTAVSSEEHEQMRAELTQRWKSAEQQIAELREEIKQIEVRIGESIRQAVANGARPDDANQRKMNEDTNLLYRLWVAKDLMLQKLLEFVESVKERLFNLRTSFSTIGWKLGPYERIRETANTSMARIPDARPLKKSTIEDLFQAVSRGRVEWVKKGGFGTLVNYSKRVRICTEQLDPQEMKFYSTIKPLVEDFKKFSDMSSEEIRNPGIDLEITPLVWALFSFEKHNTKEIISMVHALTSIGADLNSRDQSGLCAYDHARILKLDEDVISELNPFEKVESKVLFQLLDSIRKGDSAEALSHLRHDSVSLELDKMGCSPVALAIHTGCLSIIPALLEFGFSPFAIFHGYDGDYCASMALAVLREDIDSAPSQLRINFNVWVQENENASAGNDQTWIERGLDIACTQVEIWLKKEPFITTFIPGDALVIAVLLDKEDTVSAWLDAWKKEKFQTQVDCIGWAMYATIRSGNFGVVELLCECQFSGSRSWLDAHGGLDSQHFLASWWPSLCFCSKDVHHLGPRSLRKYAKDLEYRTCEQLCSHCRPRLPDYRKISKYLRAAAMYQVEQFAKGKWKSPWTIKKDYLNIAGNAHEGLDALPILKDNTQGYATPVQDVHPKSKDL